MPIKTLKNRIKGNTFDLEVLLNHNFPLNLFSLSKNNLLMNPLKKENKVILWAEKDQLLLIMILIFYLIQFQLIDMRYSSNLLILTFEIGVWSYQN